MAINKNHEAEELDGIKCAVVEKSVLPSRAEFLRQLLLLNGYSVVVAGSPPPKVAAPVAPPAEGAEPVAAPAPPPAPDTFTVGVTDLMFNPINAIFGRLLKSVDGRVVTLAYWHQKESIAHDEVPYYENR